MRKALRMAAEELANWCDAHPDSYPPTVLHVTDGEPTDGDPEPMAEQIRHIGTEDGDILFFNLHTSDGKAGPIQFGNTSTRSKTPTEKSLSNVECATPARADAAREKGYIVEDGARGFFFNVEPVEIVEFFDIGTRPRPSL